jgi:hypothetical protein
VTAAAAGAVAATRRPPSASSPVSQSTRLSIVNHPGGARRLDGWSTRLPFVSSRLRRRNTGITASAAEYWRRLLSLSRPVGRSPDHAPSRGFGGSVRRPGSLGPSIVALEPRTARKSSKYAPYPLI